MLAGVVRPEGERRIAVDAVFDLVSVATTFQKELKQAGVIFMPISEAIREHPDLVKKYSDGGADLGQLFATLNSAVFFGMARSSMCRRACAARWSFRPISASTRRKPASSSAP